MHKLSYSSKILKKILLCKGKNHNRIVIKIKIIKKIKKYTTKTKNLIYKSHKKKFQHYKNKALNNLINQYN